MRERHLPGAPSSSAWRSAPCAKCRTAPRPHGHADARSGYRWGTAPAFHSRRKQPAARHVRDEICRAACVAMAHLDVLRSCAPPPNGGPRRSKTHERGIAPHWSTSWARWRRCFGGPPAGFACKRYPVGGRNARLFPETSIIAVLLPESFRGGCSFGVGRPISPAIISVCTIVDFDLAFLMAAFRHYDCASVSFESPQSIVKTPRRCNN